VSASFSHTIKIKSTCRLREAVDITEQDIFEQIVSFTLSERYSEIRTAVSRLLKAA
jgi:hypothetical protein